MLYFVWIEWKDAIKRVRRQHTGLIILSTEVAFVYHKGKRIIAHRGFQVAQEVHKTML